VILQDASHLAAWLQKQLEFTGKGIHTQAE